MKVLITRKERQEGDLFVYDKGKILFKCVCIEPADRIDAGRYFMRKYWTPEHWNCFYIQQEPEGDDILICRGSHNHRVEGEMNIIVGRDFEYKNKNADVTESEVIMEKLFTLLPDCVEVHII